MRIGITERGDAGLDPSWIANDCDGVIAITKAPHKLISPLPENTIVHCTITGYGGTFIEPGVASPEITLESYNRLVDQYGGERIVLRIDPIIPSTKGIETAKAIFAKRRGRVRISFIDAYDHVRERFAEHGIEIPWKGVHAPLETRKKYLEEFPDVEICGEPDLVCTGCVSKKDLAVLGLYSKSDKKAKQRPYCNCLAIKKELFVYRKPCEHKCIYCYWKDN